jgi:hypothetical protein
MLSSIPAHALIQSDLVILNGVAFPIRSIQSDDHSTTLTLVGVEKDLSVVFRNDSHINVRPKH